MCVRGSDRECECVCVSPLHLTVFFVGKFLIQMVVGRVASLLAENADNASQLNFVFLSYQLRQSLGINPCSSNTT